MRKKDIALLCVERLEKLYPKAKCSLNYNNAFELLIAVRLSAQCTDARVNLVTPELFKEFPDANAFANADVKRIEQLIISCGLYKTKAKDLINIGKDIVNKYDGKVPDTIEQLITLSGVGRKTANLVCGDIYGKPAVVTDTHFIRICNRLGLVNTKDPIKVENEMRKLLPPERSNGFCHRTVLLGRDICTARTAHCEKCILNDICPKRITKKR
ncbi:MAG: endonuclease III [Clostridia bacterium]|nr:endonuclease III [Clostridia bacterium]